MWSCGAFFFFLKCPLTLCHFSTSALLLYRYQHPHFLCLFLGCLHSACLFSGLFTPYYPLLSFAPANLIPSSLRTHTAREERGGGLRPVGKVKLPAIELRFKPFLWQLSPSPAYAHNAPPNPIPLSLPPSCSRRNTVFEGLLLLLFIFQQCTCGWKRYAATAHAWFYSAQYKLTQNFIL